MRLALGSLAILLLAGCAATAFRTPPLNKQQALARTEVMELKVVKVWDVVTDALDHDREPGISHYVEVDVLSGSAAGKQLTLPLDYFYVKPPAEGAVLVLAPADWVKPPRDGKARPFGGW